MNQPKALTSSCQGRLIENLRAPIPLTRYLDYLCFVFSIHLSLKRSHSPFAPTFNAYDLVNVEKYSAYTKLLIDNTGSKPFNMHTYPPAQGDPRIAAAIKQLSRLKFGRDKSLVEADILERSQIGAPARLAPPPDMGAAR